MTVDHAPKTLDADHVATIETLRATIDTAAARLSAIVQTGETTTVTDAGRTLRRVHADLTDAAYRIVDLHDDTLGLDDDHRP